MLGVSVEKGTVWASVRLAPGDQTLPSMPRAFHMEAMGGLEGEPVTPPLSRSSGLVGLEDVLFGPSLP